MGEEGGAEERGRTGGEGGGAAGGRGRRGEKDGACGKVKAGSQSGAEPGEGAQDYALFFSPLLSIPACTGKTSYVTDFLYKPVREVSMQQNTSGPYRINFEL